MKRPLFIILAIPIILLFSWAVILKFKSKPAIETSSAVNVKATEALLSTKSKIADSVCRKLDITIDSFNKLKPVVQKAIDKIKYYEAMIAEYQKAPVIDTMEMKRFRIDLFEAKQEIKRLCESREYKIKF